MLKRLLLIMLVLVGVQSIAVAAGIDFAVLGSSIANISLDRQPGTLNYVQNTFSLSGVRFSFAPDPNAYDFPDTIPGTPALCTSAGTQSYDTFTLTEGIGNCVGNTRPGGGGSIGAQVDSGGVYGVTDGTLSMDFNSAAWGLMFTYNLLSETLQPAGAFSISAAFFSGANYVDSVYVPEDPANVFVLDPQVTYNGTFSYVGNYFDHVDLFFTPVVAPYTYYVGEELRYNTPQFAMTTFNIDTLTVVPEPGTMALLAFGLLAIGGVARRKKRI